MSVERYNARTVEIHWQRVWDAQNLFAARNDDPRPACDVTEMFPCPSARSHASHLRRSIMLDVLARYKRANGFNVLRPEGEDDSACVAAPFRSMGLSLHWSREAAAGQPAACAEAPFEVELDDIVETYGADTVRWFLLSDSPPDRDVIWMDSRIHGAWRFVHRLWRLINAAKKFSEAAPTQIEAFSSPALSVRRTAHRALARISANIEGLRFNVCVAHIYAFARALEPVVADSSEPASPDLKFAAREAAEMLVQLFHPMTPHLAEECWAALGRKGPLATLSWPAPEVGLLVEDAVTLPVHVNGQRRADVTVARDARNGDIEASVLALPIIRQALDGRSPRKVIIVPQRIINVVA